MFRFFSPPEPARATRRRRLGLEGLESRDCPSVFIPTAVVPVDLGSATPGNALALTVQHTYSAGHTVQFTGAVTGPGAGGAMVEFSGPVSGLVITDADGTFAFTAPADAFGSELVGVVQGAEVVSNITLDPIVNNAPMIQNFTVQRRDATTYEFTGLVQADHPGGLVVVFGGSPQSLQGQKAVVNDDGTFTLTIQMLGGSADTGIATAQVRGDWWDVPSDPVCAPVQ